MAAVLRAPPVRCGLLGCGVRHIRQHANPLAAHLLMPRPPPVWSDVFALPDQPALLDVGCGLSRFLLESAKANPHRNFIGVDVRGPVIELAQAAAEKSGLRNVYFTTANAHASLPYLLGSLPPGALDTVTIMHPDPCWKKRYEKRRVITTPFVQDLATYLRPGGTLYIQTDVKDVYTHAASVVADVPRFVRHAPDPPESPFLVVSNRERFCTAEGLPIFRLLYRLQHDC